MIGLLSNWLLFPLAGIIILALYFVLPDLFDLTKSKLAPRYNFLIPSVRGLHKMKETGVLGLVERGYRECGEIFRIKVGAFPGFVPFLNQSITFLVGPDAQAVLFGAKDDVVQQQDVYRFTVPVFGKGIVYDAHPKVMAQQLKMLKHGLSGSAMAVHGLKIVKETEDFFQSWSTEGEVDLFPTLSELTIMTASRCLLGQEIRETMHSEVAKLYHSLEQGMTPLSFFFPNFPIEVHRERDRARDEMVKRFSAVIHKRQETKQSQPDFLQDLMDAKYTDGTTPTAEQIGGLLLACLFAGQHTSSITSAWTGFLLISKAPELIPRLEAEQVAALATTGGKVTLDSLARMTLLQNCVKETLRMFPPLIFLMRKVKKPIQYKDYIIPEGEIIMSCPPVGHRIPSVYKNPDKFDPDRFTRGEGDGKFDYIAFGAGRHTCLGQNFGLLQITTIWSVLLRNFDFQLVDPFPDVDYTSLVAGPKGRCRIHYKRKAKPIA